ncbi:shikimate dehydrogenase [Brevibacillus fulvus]|nr:shikimate dehydrogenase [Brevibacillus fulvus]
MITSTTKLVGLLGHPVGHSFSPLMHNAAFAEKGLPFAYAAFDVDPARIGEAIAGIRALGLRGVNVTIPHKVAVMPYLDEIDPLAAQIGAVNTIVNEQDKLIGYNTDGPGYVRSLTEETGINLQGQTVTIVGAGGAARAVAFSLAKQQVKEIRLINRSRAKAEELAEQLSAILPAVVVEAEQSKEAIANSGLLINTTSVGMYPNVADTPIAAEWLHRDLIVSDLIYNPFKTRLLALAEENGATAHSGFGMFINQGALAFELWTGLDAPAELMRKTVLDALRQAV